MNNEKSVPVWLSWMRSLPLSVRLKLARRWQRIANERADWVEYIAPELKDEEEGQNDDDHTPRAS